MEKLKDWTISAIKIISGCLGVLVIITFVANYFIRSTTPEGIREGIVFTYIKDTFFQKPPFFNELDNDHNMLEDQKIFPGLSAIFRVEKTNIHEIKEYGVGLKPLDYWKVPNGFYLCTYGPDLTEVPYPEATGYMKTVLQGYRTTKNIWLIEEDFTKGIPSKVRAFREDNQSIIAEAKIVYQRKAK